jgi:hypothetical protein
MFTSQREKWADLDTIALVEFDLRKMRVRLVLAREAIRERMRELEHCGELRSFEDTPDRCRFNK